MFSKIKTKYFIIVFGLFMGSLFLNIYSSSTAYAETISKEHAQSLLNEFTSSCHEGDKVTAESRCFKIAIALTTKFDCGATYQGKKNIYIYDGTIKEIQNGAIENCQDKINSITSPTDIAVKTGKDGVEANKTKAQACGGIGNADLKKSCEKAYVASATIAAKKIGTTAAAGDANDNACDSLGLKGSAKELRAYKKACQSAYKSAKTSTNAPDENARDSCGGVSTYFTFGDICDSTSTKKGGSANPIIALALTLVSWVTAFVSVAVVGGIVYGGFLYLAAQDNASQTQKGITIIVDSVIGLILLMGMFVVINFIVPGGLFT